MVEVKAIEESLDRISSYKLLSFKKGSLIFFAEVKLFAFEVVSLRWNPRGFHLFWKQGFPIETLEPRMILKFLDSIVEAQSIHRLSPNALVSEVSGFNAPWMRNLMSSNLNLLSQYAISNLLFVLSTVRSLSEHHFIDNDTNCKHVRDWKLSYSTHSLRRHIAWSTTWVNDRWISRINGDTYRRWDLSGNSKVSQF